MKKLFAAIFICVFAIGVAADEPREVLDLNDFKSDAIERIKYLIEQDFPDQEIELMKAVHDELLQAERNNNERISDLARELAEIIPEADFITMFTTNEEYAYRGRYMSSNKIPEDILSALLEDLPAAGTNDPRLLPCTCKLLCQTSGTNCNPTEDGCGWLWRYPCTGEGISNLGGVAVFESGQPKD